MADGTISLTKEELSRILALAWGGLHQREGIEFLFGNIQPATIAERNFLKSVEQKFLVAIDKRESSMYSDWQPYTEDNS